VIHKINNILDIGYGYLHRIPVSVDRSQPVENALSGLSISQQEPPKPNVPQPGFTGIPQVDRINQVSTSSAAVAPKEFPDPSEFLSSPMDTPVSTLNYHSQITRKEQPVL
jgi:hypothetical protein